MLTRRGYFLIVLLFLVLTSMFMLVGASTNIEIPINASTRPEELVFAGGDGMQSGPLKKEDSQAVAGIPIAANQHVAALLVPQENSPMAELFVEWCSYNQCAYRMITEPSASALEGCNLILVGEWQDAWRDCLLQAADVQRQIIITQMPDRDKILRDPELADFLGIRESVASSCQLEAVQFFDGFFVGGMRTYEATDERPYAVPHYALRSGYLIFANGIPQDESLSYTEYPPILWRTRTQEAEVFVTNTDLFSGKQYLGLLTAYLSQMPACYLYPIVNARTVSVENFPCLSEENTETLRTLYGNGSSDLTRDQFWPTVEKIIRNYDQSATFFTAPQLDYSEEPTVVTDLIGYYYSQLMKISGSMELSLNVLGDIPLAQVLEKIQSFSAQHLHNYRFTACAVEAARLEELLECSNEILNETTLIMTDMTDTFPLLAQAGERVVVSFTDDGILHDDLTLVTLATALGVTNQHVDMVQVYYPENGEDKWTEMGREWSRNVSYLNDFRFLEASSLYQLEEKTRNFLSMNYEASFDEQRLVLRTESAGAQASFLLRLNRYQVSSITGGTVTRLASGLYLLQATGEELVLEVEPIYQVPIPGWTEEVVQ